MSPRHLPARPDLEHLRKQAKDLHRAARDGDAEARGRIAAVHPTFRGAAPGRPAIKLADAQLALAREYGHASWLRLKAAVELLTADRTRRLELLFRYAFSALPYRARAALTADPDRSCAYESNPLGIAIYAVDHSQIRHRARAGHRRCVELLVAAGAGFEDWYYDVSDDWTRAHLAAHDPRGVG